jgi:hypothetical protein
MYISYVYIMYVYDMYSLLSSSLYIFFLPSLQL